MSDRRYARHAMLPEVGAGGQARLSATELSVDPSRAAAVTREYLERAGVVIRDGAPLAARVEVAPGRDELGSAAAHLSGAWSALEAIKAALGVGQPASTPHVTLLGPERP